MPRTRNLREYQAGAGASYTYDKLNRLTQVTLPDSGTVVYTYDATTGDLTNVAGPNIGYTFSYDTMGRMTSVTDTRGYTLAYAYNALGQRTLLTLPGSQTIAYGYDTGNRLSTLGTGAGIFTFSYDTKGRRSALAYPNGITSTYSYDNADQLTGLVHAATSGDILNIAYPSLDNIGNRIQRSEDSVTTSYSYDDPYRVLTATNTNATEAFTYDAVGNRLTGPTSGDAYTYNDAHQLTQAGTASYTYDSNGNQLTRDGWSQQWDAQNRLIQLQSSDGVDTITFKYDPFNRRIEKQHVETLAGVTTITTTQYVYDGEDIVLQLQTVADNDGTTTTTKTHFNHGPGIDEPLAMVEGGDKYYYHADGLGSIVAITDDARNVVQKYSYGSFGTPTPTDPDFIQPYTFTGREWDDEAELYFYRARYYDPSVGRFISKDPIAIRGNIYNQGVNVTFFQYVSAVTTPYLYTENNPLNFIDPTGLVKGDWWDYRTYVSFSTTEITNGRGTVRSLDGSEEMAIIDPITMAGISFDIMIGGQPDTCDSIYEGYAGFSKSLSIGAYGINEENSGFDGIAFHIGWGTPVPLGGAKTLPAHTYLYEGLSVPSETYLSKPGSHFSSPSTRFTRDGMMPSH